MECEKSIPRACPPADEDHQQDCPHSHRRPILLEKRQYGKRIRPGRVPAWDGGCLKGLVQKVQQVDQAGGDNGMGTPGQCIGEKTNICFCQNACDLGLYRKTVKPENEAYCHQLSQECLMGLGDSADSCRQFQQSCC